MSKEELKPIDVTKFTITESGNVLRNRTMSKEELKKEAEEYALDTYEMCSYSDLPYASDRRAREQAYIAGAEPREKQIADLEEQNKDLTLKIDRLESACDAYNYSQRTYQEEIKELKAQIEKMKCCINDLVHLGEFNEHTDEEYFNYQVHEALNNAGQFIKEIKEK